MKTRIMTHCVVVLSLLWILVSCSSSGGGDGSSAPAGTLTYTVGGSVSGLSGTVVLQNNGTDDLTVTADGTFAFTTAVANNGAYVVTVLTQPALQTCSASNNSGTIAGANVTNIAVVCSVNAYTIGGTVSGLTGTLVLQDNGTDDLTITSAGSFTFAHSVADRSSYVVTIKSAPATQTCLVTNGTGTMNSANVSNVSVVCTNKTWQNPASLADNISPDGSNIFNPQAAMDDRGNAAVVWTQLYTASPACGNSGSPSPCYGIFKSEFRNGVWTHPTATADHISPAGFMADSPSVVSDNKGNALIVWRQFDASFLCAGDCPSAYKSEFRNGAWSSPTSVGNLGVTNPYASPPRAAMDDNGNALIVWRQQYSAGDGIFMSEYRNGVWTQPTSTAQHISPSGSGQTAQNPQVAMDSNGNAIVVWQQSDGAFYQIYKSEYRNGAWTHPANLAANISPDSQNAVNPQVAMDNNGNAIIVWQQNDGPTYTQIYKSVYRNGTWTHPTNLTTDHISLDNQNASAPQVAMDNNGNAIITWMQASNSSVFKSEYRNGIWQNPSSLADSISPATRSLSGLQLSMDDNGNALIVWSQNDDSVYFCNPAPPNLCSYTNYLQVYKAEYRNGAWSKPLSATDNISINNQPADSPAVAMGNNGDAIIVQRQLDGSMYQVFKSQYR